MQFKILLKLMLLAVILAGITFSASLIFHLNFKNPSRERMVSFSANTPAFSAEGQMRPGIPVRLKIPSIKVDASVEYVGVNSSGEMDVPKGPDNVAWFEPGVIPGDNGSAAIAGHFGWKDDIPAVFDDLNKLKKGDKIYIEDDKGGNVTFIVRELKTFGEKADASDVFVSNDGKSHLNLITCEGSWNKVKKSYSGRLVVFTDKE